jgi:hypothetical protein
MIEVGTFALLRRSTRAKELLTMTIPDPEPQDKKRALLADDARVRDALRADQSRNASTYLDHVEPPLDGRFGVTEHRTITGVASPVLPPLPATSPWSGSQPEPSIEPPTGYCIDEMVPLEPATSPSPVEAQAIGDLTSGDDASLPDLPLANVKQRGVRSPSSSSTEDDGNG